VALENPEYLVVAVDPVNFEKPYAKAIEGVSVVHKATPPDLDGHARLTHGYPAITATTVNTKVPVTSYANWFPYKTADFISQNKEIGIISIIWGRARLSQAEFISRLSHEFGQRRHDAGFGNPGHANRRRN